MSALNCMVEYTLAGDRRSLMKEAKIELNIQKYLRLGHVEKG